MKAELVISNVIALVICFLLWIIHSDMQQLIALVLQ